MAPVLHETVVRDFPRPTSVVDVHAENEMPVAAVDTNVEEAMFFGVVLCAISYESRQEKHIAVSDTPANTRLLNCVDATSSPAVDLTSPEDEVDGIGDICGGLLHQSMTSDRAMSPELQQQYKDIARKLDQIATEVDRYLGPTSRRTPTVQELIAQAITYDSFDDMISAAIGMDPNTNHLVQFYRLSRDIVTFATNSRTGRNLVDWAHTYFRRHLLPWIVENNGLENVVEQLLEQPANADN